MLKRVHLCLRTKNNETWPIAYWLKSAEDDGEVLQYLLKGGKYVYALSFGHLYLEKWRETIYEEG